jgi:hypothetical protein
MNTWWDDTEERREYTFEQMDRLAEAGWFITRTLDFGCGDMPYRSAIAGEYVPYDKLLVGADAVLAPFDFIVCTWVLHELRDPSLVLGYFREWLAPAGRLFLTVPCIGDGPFLFTPSLITRMLEEAGFDVDDVETLLRQHWGSPAGPVGETLQEVPIMLAVTAKVRS